MNIQTHQTAAVQDGQVLCFKSAAMRFLLLLNLKAPAVEQKVATM
jgi:hypothetical protein